MKNEIDLSRFECLVGEVVTDDIGMILGVGVSVELETAAYWGREYPVLVLDNGNRIDLTYMKVEE